MFFIPVCMVMRALVNADDFGLYQQLIKGQEDNQFFKTLSFNKFIQWKISLCGKQQAYILLNCRSIVTMLRELSEKDLFTQSDVLKMIGSKFRVKMTELPPWYTDTQVADYLLK